MFPQIQPPKHLPITWGFTTRNNTIDDQDIKTPIQVHGNLITEYKSDKRLESSDALYTTERGVVLAVRVADCAPILFAGRLNNDEIFAGVVHAGWRGATLDIFGMFIDRFLSLGGQKDTAAWAIGPCIKKCHFQVGNEVFKAAEKHQHWLTARGVNKNHKDYFDLPDFLRLQAISKGLNPALDFSKVECTYCNPNDYYSFRRGDLKSRQCGWVKIE